MFYILFCSKNKKYHIEADDIFEAQKKLRIINPDATVLAYKKEVSIYEFVKSIARKTKEDIYDSLL